MNYQQGDIVFLPFVKFFGNYPLCIIKRFKMFAD